MKLKYSCLEAYYWRN